MNLPVCFFLSSTRAAALAWMGQLKAAEEDMLSAVGIQLNGEQSSSADNAKEENDQKEAAIQLALQKDLKLIQDQLRKVSSSV